MRLRDKAALVTGAANGIGLACARAFATEGAKVMIADVDSEGASAPVILPPDVFRPRSQPTAPVTTSELKAGTSQ